MDLSDTKKELIKVLNEAQVLDEETGYVYFERVWANIQVLKRCTELVHEELQSLNSDLGFIPKRRSDLVILTPDTVEGRLGALPLSFLLAERLGSNVVVWKEYADFRWGRARLLGDLREKGNKNKTVVIIQDIVESGATALRMLYALNSLEIDWNVALHYSVIYGGRSSFGGKLSKQFHEIGYKIGNNINFRYGISVNDLRTGGHNNV